MSGQAAGERAQATERNVARVRVAAGPLLGPVLARVVSMTLARADWPVDRLDDALLVCDALSAHAPAYAGAGRFAFSVNANEREAELRVLELTAGEAAALVRDTMLPVVGNVIERLAAVVSVEPDERGEGSELVLVLNSR
jgi:hypothetical protein